MPFDAPFQLGPFHVGHDGGLSLAGPDRLPRFTIQWRGCRVEARLTVRDRGDPPGGAVLGDLSLQATVGRVPSTARVAAAQARIQRDTVFAALRSLPATLPEGWRTDLLADHRVVLLAASKVEMPTTITSLLTDVTLFLMALGPYLELLEEVGVEPPAAAPEPAGMVNTWPG
jgi:hypothetical protein